MSAGSGTGVLGRLSIVVGVLGRLYKRGRGFRKVVRGMGGGA